MTSLAHIEAQRETDDVARAGEALWRMAGPHGSTSGPPGERAEYVDRELRDRLTEALAEVVDLRAVSEELNAARGEVATLASDFEIGNDFDAAILAVADAAQTEIGAEMERLICALARDLASKREEIVSMEKRLADRPVEVVVRAPAARVTHRPRLGETTLSLPFFPPREEPIVIREVMPSRIGKVKKAKKKPVAKPRAKRTKAAS